MSSFKDKVSEWRGRRADKAVVETALEEEARVLSRRRSWALPVGAVALAAVSTAAFADYGPGPPPAFQGTVAGAATIAAAAAMNLSAHTTIIVDRWTTATPFAPAIYHAVAVQPTHSAKFQDTTGQWFELYEPNPSVEMLGAMGDGVTADQTAFTNAIALQRPLRLMSASYYFSATATIPNGGVLDLEGIPVARPSITGANGIFLFTRDTALATYFPHGVILKHISFNGQHVRSGTWPYSAAVGSYGFFSTFSLQANPDDTSSFAYVEDCEFKDIVTYPYQFYNFQSVSTTHCSFSRTLDPGYVACANGDFSDNYSEYSADNAVSVSRGCIRFTATNNILKDPAISGIWFSGFNITESGTATATGTYTAGGSVTIVSSVATFFAYMKGYMLTLEDGSGNQAVFKITAVGSTTSVTATVITAVPAGLQGLASTAWFLAPMLGASEFVASNNVILGGNQNGIAASIGARNGVISDNLVMRSGITADSEVSDTVTVATGSTSATVGNGALWTALDYVIIEPINSFQDYFIARISSKVGNVLTLDRVAPRTYAAEGIRLAHLNNSLGMPFYVVGNSVGGHVYSEDIRISNNQCIDFRGYGMHLGGTSTGSVRRVSIDGNKFAQPRGMQGSGVSIIRIAEYTGTSSDDLVITNNTTDTTAVFIEAYVRGTTVRPWVINDNYARSCPSASYVTVFDADNANADISSLYQYSRVDGTGVRRATARKIDSWVTSTINAGVVDVGGEALVVTPGSANVNITSFTQNGIGTSGLGVFVLRNAHATNTLTLVNNAASLRTGTGGDVIIPGYGQVQLVFLNLTVVGLVARTNPAAVFYQNKPTSPTGTTNTTAVMMGLAGTFTPVLSGRVMVTLSGSILNATAIGDGAQVQMRYGTGAAPANGDALVGTLFTSNVRFVAATTAERAPFTLTGIMGYASALTLGTAYWIDAGLAALTAGTAQIIDLQMTAYELAP